MNNPSGVEIRVDVPYGGGPRGDLCVDLYLPTSTGKHPGAALSAWRRLAAWLSEAVQKLGPLAGRKRLSVVAVDYRLSSQISPAWPGVWEDVCRSLHWLIAQASSWASTARKR